MSVKTTQIAIHESSNAIQTSYEVEVYWPGFKRADLRRIAVSPKGLKAALVDIAEAITGGE